MAVCEQCGADMLYALGCDPDPSTYLYGREPKWLLLDVTPPERCRDCNAAQGEPHHHGCCVADCVDCGQQAFGCPCPPEDD